MEMKWVPIQELKPFDRNPNQHSDEQIERLAKLIKYQGWRLPIIVSNQNGMIAAGHGRLAAAKKLGLKEVPVHYQDFESEEQFYAFVVSDNAISSWSELDLAQINFEVQNLGPEFDIDLLGMKDFMIDPSDIAAPDIEDFKELEQKKLKFYTCPHCEQEFEEKQAMVRING